MLETCDLKGSRPSRAGPFFFFFAWDEDDDEDDGDDDDDDDDDEDIDDGDWDERKYADFWEQLWRICM